MKIFRPFKKIKDYIEIDVKTQTLDNFCLENNILIIGYSPLDQGYIADGNIKKYIIQQIHFNLWKLYVWMEKQISLKNEYLNIKIHPKYLNKKIEYLN